MSGFEVMKERCNQCLYGPDKIVSNKRRSEIIRKVDREDGYFICHKSSMAGGKICCRGDFDRGGGGQLGRIAGRLGCLNFVDEPNPTQSKRARAALSKARGTP